MKIHIELVWLPLLKPPPQTTGKWGLHVRKLNSIYIYEAIQNVESFSLKSRVSRNGHVSKPNCAREQGLANKLSLKLQKTLDINFKAYYSSDDMDINKSSRKKECSKTTNKTYLLAFLGKCWLLIIHLNRHRYFYILGSLFQQLVNGDGIGCWIFYGFFEVHFLFLRWGGNGENFRLCKTLDIHLANLYWALHMMKCFYRLWMKVDRYSGNRDVTAEQKEGELSSEVAFGSLCRSLDSL